MRPALPNALQSTIDDIRSMRVRGAAAIAQAGAQSLADHVRGLAGKPASVLAKARKAAKALDGARPTAVSLHNALGWVLAAICAERTAGDMHVAARDAARLVALEITGSRASIARHGAKHLKDGDVVLTHCHSTAVVAILQQAHEAGKANEVIATETRPFRQGLRTVKALHAAGIETALIVDSAVEHTLQTRDIDAVLVGADTVSSDGSLFNKIGTAGVARLAEAHEVPLYSAAGLHKFSRRPADDIPIEERPATEVAAPKEVPRGVRVFNPVFDRTGPFLVDAYVTEEGLASPKKAVARNLPLLPPETVWG